MTVFFVILPEYKTLQKSIHTTIPAALRHILVSLDRSHPWLQTTWNRGMNELSSKLILQY